MKCLEAIRAEESPEEVERRREHLRTHYLERWRANDLPRLEAVCHARMWNLINGDAPGTKEWWRAEVELTTLLVAIGDLEGPAEQVDVQARMRERAKRAGYELRVGNRPALRRMRGKSRCIAS